MPGPLQNSPIESEPVTVDQNRYRTLPMILDKSHNPFALPRLFACPVPDDEFVKECIGVPLEFDQ